METPIRALDQVALLGVALANEKKSQCRLTPKTHDESHLLPETHEVLEARPLACCMVPAGFLGRYVT